jgi:hypothetical protein
MRAELLDVHGDWRCEALGTKHVESCRRAIEFVVSGSLCLARALLEVTNGGVFWVVALGPAKWAMRAFPSMISDLI